MKYIVEIGNFQVLRIGGNNQETSLEMSIKSYGLDDDINLYAYYIIKNNSYNSRNSLLEQLCEKINKLDLVKDSYDLYMRKRVNKSEVNIEITYDDLLEPYADVILQTIDVPKLINKIIEKF